MANSPLHQLVKVSFSCRLVSIIHRLFLGCFKDQSCEFAIVADTEENPASIQWTVAISAPRECQLRHIVVRFRRHGDRDVQLDQDFAQLALRYEPNKQLIHTCSEIEHDLANNTGNCLTSGPFKSKFNVKYCSGTDPFIFSLAQLNPQKNGDAVFGIVTSDYWIKHGSYDVDVSNIEKSFWMRIKIDSPCDKTGEAEVCLHGKCSNGSRIVSISASSMATIVIFALVIAAIIRQD